MKEKEMMEDRMERKEKITNLWFVKDRNHWGWLIETDKKKIRWIP